ncbi:hypothetical protein HID58_062298 [Brassica napus]|uniref:Uncharacterized protein n=1 Tax=Brassica napus TaxID=3708 RepID=A0ABQ8A118_BRANA|nr:hypothetical protein HID58_062298 [Brassica napus]
MMSHASRKEKLRFNDHNKNRVFFNKGRYLKETGHNMEYEWKRMILNWRLYIARDKVTTDGVFVEAAQSSFWFCFRRVSTSQVIKKG